MPFHTCTHARVCPTCADCTRCWRRAATYTAIHTRPRRLQVERLLAGADGWQFDTWRLREATQGHPLSTLGFFLLQRSGERRVRRPPPLRLHPNGYLDMSWA